MTEKAKSFIDLDTAQAFNILAWIEHNHIVNENQSLIEFFDHAFLRDPYLDDSSELVVMKATQIGWSVLAILKSIWFAKYRGANIVYTLPSKSVVKDFVSPKVDPLIESNPSIKALIGKTDSTALKAIDKRFIYFRGSWEIGAALSISANILVNDEVDRSNQKVLAAYQRRLDDSRRTRPDLGHIWQFSNPSIPGAGVDEKWQMSDQKHWFVKCPLCNYDWYLKFPDNINFETQSYICAKCHRDLPDDARRRGRWVNKRESDISGYWISQMMIPWHPASKIIKDSEGDQEIFYNFTLGLPYISKDYTVDRQTILDCINPDANPRTNVAIGVDNGRVKHYVIGNRYGIFQVGVTESWDEIEDLRNRYSAYMVIDALPYPNVPQRLVKQYPGKVFVNYYSTDRKAREVLKWGDKDKRGVVYSDRTKIIDSVVADLHTQDIWFNLTLTDLEEYIYHWGQLYRTVEESAQGIKVPKWETIEGKPDHFAHATVYWYIALQRTLNQGGVILPQRPKKEEVNPTISIEHTMPALNINEVIERAKRNARRRKRRT